MSLSHDTLKALHEAATKGEWNVWRQPAPTPVVAKIELSSLVDHTENRIDALVMLEVDGKCPAITGCGPTSDDNAALIAYLCSESTRTEILTLIAERDAMRGALEDISSSGSSAETYRRIALAALGGNHHGS